MSATCRLREIRAENVRTQADCDGPPNGRRR